MIEKMYEDALLSAGAYIDWNGLSDERIREILIHDYGFTEKQYNKYFDPKEGIYKVGSDDYIELENGFSATVFRNEKSGGITVAFRGTDSLIDWDTNLSALLGIDPTLFIESQDNNITTFLRDSGLLDASGNLLPNVNFTGHSLGGYLATIATYKYADSISSPTSSFNGLGISPLSFFTNEVINDISVEGKLNNYYADVVGAVVGVHPGDKYSVFIENEGVVSDHSMRKLVESVSVYRVFTAIDKDLNTEEGLVEIAAILETVSDVADQTLETVLEKIQKIFGSNLSSNLQDVETIYQELDAFTTQSGVNFSVVKTNELQASATSDDAEGFAYRHALNQLNTFAIVGSAGFYAQHNQSQVLDSSHYSDEWLTHRAGFINRIDWFNSNDLKSFDPYSINLNNLPLIDQDTNHYINESKYFYDAGTATRIQQGGLFNNTERYIFGDLSESSDKRTLITEGSGVGDFFFGGGGKDTFKGLGGDDYIEGNKGDDHLEGGDGIDTYYFNPGTGHDTIVDSDGNGQLKVGNLTLIGTGDKACLIENDHYVWQDDVNGFRYELDKYKNLVITGGNLIATDSITIEDFDIFNNSLGIHLNFQREGALVIGDNQNHFMDASDAVAQLSEISESGSQSLKFVSNYAASEGDKLVVTLENDQASSLALTTGAETINMGAGPIELVLNEGQTELTFMIANTSDLDVASDYVINASWVSADDSFAPVSSDFILSVKGTDEEASGFATTNVIAGDKAPLVNEHDEIQYDILGNVIADGEASDRDDLIHDSAENDHILAGGGDDDIHRSRGGNDSVDLGSGDDNLYSDVNVEGIVHVRGGTGRDYLGGSASHDLFEGGEGADGINAGAGDDRIFGDHIADTAELISLGASQSPSGEIGEWINAGDGNDQIYSGSGDDLIAGGDGNDFIVAGAGDDLILSDSQTTSPANWREWSWSEHITTDADGITSYSYTHDPVLLSTSNGSGDDVVYAGAGNDVFEGGKGSDTAYLENGDDKAWGSEGNDVLLGGTGNDLLHGDNADDATGSAQHGHDFLDGGEGDDRLYGGSGSDTLYGGAGNDSLIADSSEINFGDDYLDGESGNDFLKGGAGSDTLYGGADDDELYGDSTTISSINQGDDFLDGGTGNDLLHGYAGDDTLLGGAGDDILVGDLDDTETGYFGNDYLDGGEGNDELTGSGSEDILSGGAGNDILLGDTPYISGLEHADDDLDGGDGNDQIDGNGGSDLLRGGNGDDILYGDGGVETLYHGDDVLFGDAGNDTLYAGAGDDILHSGEGNDALYGDAGNDILYSESGSNTLTGGEGSDTFVIYNTASDVEITDADANDRIIFAHSAAEPLKTSVVSNENGDVYLSLKYGESHVYLNDGMQAGFGQVDAGGFTYTDKAHFLNDTISTSIFYQLENTGEIYGGRFDDTLVGSDQADVIYGNAGNDLLAGAGGDDLLEGGEGLDEYRAGIGSGRDRLIESEGANSTVKLLAGLAINDLSFEKEEDDLFIRFGQARDGVVLDNYYTSNQSWLIKDANGDSLLLNEDNPPALSIATIEDSVEQVWQSFSGKIETSYGAYLRTQGYREEPDGTYSITTTNNSNPYNRRISNINVDFANHQLDVPYENYQRSIADSSLESIASRQKTLNEEVSTGATGATYVSAGNTAAYYIEGNRDYSWGFKSSITDTVIPLYGADTFYNPLSGELSREIEGYWVYPQDITPATTTLSSNRYTETDFKQTLNIVEITGSSVDDNIDTRSTRFNLVDGGDGNDVIDARKNYREGPYAGSLLYGNNGDDILYGSVLNDTLIGGAGQDRLVGGKGNDTYYLFDYTGGDIIIGDDGDVLVLPAGVTFDDLQLSLFERLESEGQYESEDGNGKIQSMYTVLKLSWSGSLGVEIILPHSEQEAGIGLDRVIDASGQSRAFVNLLAEADQAYEQDVHQQDNVIAGQGMLKGYDGDDRLTASSDNELESEGFHNILVGGAGHDHLQGSDQNDKLIGANVISDYSYDILQLHGTYEDEGNTFNGGKGNDEIWATSGSDTFIFELGDGADVITDTLHQPPGLESLASQNNHDILKFDAGINPQDIIVYRSSEPLGERWTMDEEDSLVFAHINNADSIEFQNWFKSNANQLNQVEFEDGTVWSYEDVMTLASGGTLDVQPQPKTIATENDDVIKLKLLPADDESGFIDGLGGNDIIRGDNQANILFGATGDDRLFGHAGNDLLFGGDGNDRIKGGSGADHLVGGKGRDRFIVGSGDVVSTNAGDGRDVVRIKDNTEGFTISLGRGILAENMKFRHSRDDLVMKTAADTSIRIKNWFLYDEAALPEVTLQMITGVNLADEPETQVHSYDFTALANAFNQTESSQWSVVDALLDAHLASSESEAIGGSLSVDYALDGVLSSTAIEQQSVLKQDSFGTTPQLFAA